MRNIGEFHTHQYCFYAHKYCDTAVIEMVSLVLATVLPRTGLPRSPVRAFYKIHWLIVIMLCRSLSRVFSRNSCYYSLLNFNPGQFVSRVSSHRTIRNSPSYSGFSQRLNYPSQFKGFIFYLCTSFYYIKIVSNLITLHL